MTPNPNPSPEAIMCGGCGETNSEKRCMGCMHDFGTPESAWVQKYATAPTAALSQTLPAPGEVEQRDLIGRELIGWDNQMSPEAIAHPNNAAFFAHWLDVTDPNDGEQAKHYQAGINMILRLTPTLATVAAANDEAVAGAIEAAAKVALKHAGMLDLAQGHDDAEGQEDRWYEGGKHSAQVIAAAIRLLSQGGGK